MRFTAIFTRRPCMGRNRLVPQRNARRWKRNCWLLSPRVWISLRLMRSLLQSRRLMKV
ncbi:unnamed protein product [Linum tenue]|uniref:Uncharacterized protein n=1 Tax=Linum tenue TaxID=586396 RepID=A0AAV0S030_9ROSI|nr:unnamed protein product [Linum tenue]